MSVKSWRMDVYNILLLFRLEPLDVYSVPGQGLKYKIW